MIWPELLRLTSFLNMLGTDLIILPALSPTVSGMKRAGSEDSVKKLASI